MKHITIATNLNGRTFVTRLAQVFHAPFLSFVRVSHGMNCSHYYYMKPWVLLMQYIANEEIQMLIKRKIS